MNQARALYRVLSKLEGLPILIVLIVELGVFYALAPLAFHNFQIYASFLEIVPNTLVCALGLTFVIAAGEIDLSFPAVVALSGFIFAWIFKNVDSPLAPWLGIVLALLAGGVVGYVNGILVARIGVPSIMATLATQFFWLGVTVLLAGGSTVPIGNIDNNIVHTIFASRLFGDKPGLIPIQALWTLGIAVVLWFLFNRHTFGEAILFIGDNVDVARVMGINVEATKIKLFTMSAILAAFAGLLVTIDVETSFPTQGTAFLLPALASVFVGGTSIAGGQGTIIGTFFGSYIIGSLEPGVVATGIGGYWVQIVEGMVMGAVMVLNIVLEKGQLTRLTNRVRHWGVPIRSPTTGERARRDDEALTS